MGWIAAYRCAMIIPNNTMSNPFAEERYMDPLSGACLSLKIQNMESAQFYGGGYWVSGAQTSGDLIFSASIKGSSWLAMVGLVHPILIEEGDCYVTTNPHGFRRSSKPDIEAADLSFPLARVTIWPAEVKSGHVVIRYPGKCDNSSIGARLVFEDRTNLLINLLPPLIHIRANSDAASVFRSMLHVLVCENAIPCKLGSLAMIDHLVGILLVQTLRICVDVEDRPRGWLGALVDPKIGDALVLMHSHGARQWTVEDLAAAVGMSRSSFALRFKTVVGQAPLDYWLQWRMHHAGHMLRNSNQTVSSVAFAWGYESEKSFGKAFKRVMGCSPTSYRMADRTRSMDTNHERFLVDSRQPDCA
jgi:AraC-like DNA-binding protein